MDIFKEETEPGDIHRARVVDLSEGRPCPVSNIGFLRRESTDELDDTGVDDNAINRRVDGHNYFYGHPRPSDMNRDIKMSGNHKRLFNFYQSTPDYLHRPPSVEVPAKENDTEQRSRVLAAEKNKEQDEKQQLKNERKDDVQESDAEDSTAVNDKSKEITNSRVKQLASAKDRASSESSDDESTEEDSDTKDDSGDSEELDMTSTFVSVVKRKLEQRPKPERKEKKQLPVKGERKTVPEKLNEDQEVGNKDSATTRPPTLEDNIKISTEFANIGNKFANSGDLNSAVKYFTDAIKYNPTEYKLFGNRSFCFEKMQEYEKALADAELCLGLCSGWVKGLFRKGRALAGLKRYEEAAQAFKEVLKLDSSYAEAAQELMRVQITQLMEYGFTREQSSNALIIHGTVKKSLEVLMKLNHQPGAIQHATVPTAQVANVTGVSPVLSANTSCASAALTLSQAAPKVVLKNRALGPVQNMSNDQCTAKPIPTYCVKSSRDHNGPPPELFPVWVGNLIHPVPDSAITNLFSKVGDVYSVKVLISKRCAFVNFTKQEYCDKAIRCLHGVELNGVRIAVRYPDRIPQGMGISKSALKAEDRMRM
ncbi:tetratricopeptide repeat protein 31-like isoform X2 [Mastacembelus armatus]|uniref:tetratricopeptide repeat protein 31-like isoform X2 n=1 Tax=Mastacembelus armatus TaxID=205130 RepID=UPI000E465A40|nr:tetratricopeptide repeat protein 31-like isoform X2 [Mastacembelus armatus]